MALPELDKKLRNIPTKQRLKQMEAWLNARFPPPRPVKVRVECIKDNPYGECYESDDGKYIMIRLNKNINRADKLDTLLHEWGHALVSPNIDHGPAWGKAYAKVYGAWHDKGGYLESYIYFK
jgi:hypothetical protein